MGVRAKRSHIGPAVRGGGISFAAGSGVLVTVGAKTGTTGPNYGTTGQFRAPGPDLQATLRAGQLARSTAGGTTGPSEVVHARAGVGGQLSSSVAGQLARIDRGPVSVGVN